MQGELNVLIHYWIFLCTGWAIELVILLKRTGKFLCVLYRNEWIKKKKNLTYWFDEEKEVLNVICSFLIFHSPFLYYEFSDTISIHNIKYWLYTILWLHSTIVLSPFETNSEDRNQLLGWIDTGAQICEQLYIPKCFLNFCVVELHFVHFNFYHVFTKDRKEYSRSFLVRFSCFQFRVLLSSKYSKSQLAFPCPKGR